MPSQSKCRELIETRIVEGKELTKIFTKNLEVTQLYPIGTICLSTWMIESLRIFDYIGIEKTGHEIYNIFEGNLKNIGNLTLNTFEELIVYLQYLEKTFDVDVKELTI